MSERSHFTQVVSQKIHEYLIDVDENKPGSKYEAVVSALCSTARNSNLDLDKIMESVLEKDLSEYQKAFLAATCK